MSYFDRYPQATFSVDDAIAQLWHRVNHIDKILTTAKNDISDLLDNPKVLNTYNYNTALTFDVKRLGRLLFRLMDNNGDAVDFSHLQSHCEDGSYVYLFFNADSTNNCCVRKFNKETKTVVQTATITDGGHGNGCTYCEKNNRIYLVESNTDKVYVLDPSDLSVEATLHTGMDNFTKAIAYDKDRDLFWITRVTGLTTNHGVYGFKHTTDGLELEQEFTVLNYGNLGTATQDIEYYNNAIYMMTSKPNNISAISVPDGHLIRSWSVSSNECTVGELEGISCYNGNWLITSNKLSATRGSYNVTQFFQANYYDGVQANQTCGECYSKLQKIPIPIYVDINSTEFNPDGTIDHPYKEVFEAIDQETCDYKNNARIIVKAGSYDSIGLHDGADVTIEGQTDNDCAIRGFFVSSGARLYMKKMRITRNIYYSLNNTYGNLIENGGDVTLQNCWLEMGNSANYNIYVASCSKLKMVNSVFTENNVSRGILVGDGAILHHDFTGAISKIVKNNKSGLVLPSEMTLDIKDSAVSISTNLNAGINSQQIYWKYIKLDLLYQDAHMYVLIPSTSTSTNVVLTSAEGYCKLHLEDNHVTCVHNDLTGLAWKGYSFVN